jgi:alanine racemase
MRASLTIDLSAIRRNWRALAALAAPTPCAAVVKADAYGLGMERVAPALAAEGARTFFTALPEEGLALRAILGPEPAIYAFNGLCAETAGAMLAEDVRPLLNDPAQATLARQTAQAAGRPFPCGLQLDTGMNRLGFEAADLAALLEDDGLAGLAPDLIVSHLACSDDPADPQNAAQRDAFLAMTAHPALAGLRRSLSATGGTALLGPDFRFDLVRPGVGLYGGAPFAAAEPVVRLDLPVIQIRRVEAGETVGYGGAFAAAAPLRVATVAAGYADGLIRAMGGRAAAVHRGRRLPFVGRVSMDLVTIDVTTAPDLRPGDAVTLLGPEQGVDALAHAAGTIGYEILTSLGTRYARRYVG